MRDIQAIICDIFPRSAIMQGFVISPCNARIGHHIPPVLALGRVLISRSKAAAKYADIFCNHNSPKEEVIASGGNALVAIYGGGGGGEAM